ncbi:hypothetical protein [Pseudomonas typographi]|uniref:Uncharacterized protein n=1 Tax=Pseudomonas typographi TaxID=2715964 RepID=A0ABR7Z660_9PSED|nr:hypothetical protein [Pseudomonas typographi]MBD1554319.1 hypothetical protein [Pseudomonas typographi]MBD1589547.1 hypothetical protein [Pseudomonas typographi]MBD1600927.1 hypothetical protein [Pseudomonas typographi]
MSYNLASKPFEERQAIEQEKARHFENWKANIGKAKADAARLIAEKPRRKGKWAEWVRAELEQMAPAEYANMVRSEVNKLMAAAK